jgi:hypothetical protein
VIDVNDVHPGDKIRKAGRSVEVLALCEAPGRAWVVPYLVHGMVCFTQTTPYVVDLQDYQLEPIPF